MWRNCIYNCDLFLLIIRARVAYKSSWLHNYGGSKIFNLKSYL